ncbi:hypothetical protein PVL29_009562 [Vitis rotundifolia]|uniref:Uncharacterized protein n=1 Tax=Vitis rotundifolia TaxID=103349 RepID=A0AA38ZRM5_VITRO|nr:hypothetical protein PVL29_009562 [Vitis rotundifolia]
MEILRRMPCFTNAEPPSTKMSNFFPFTKWVSVSLGGDPPAFVTARFPLGTPESMVSRIQLLQGCTAQETAEVRLEVVETMRAFITQCMSGIKELHIKLESVESDLATTQKAAADGAEALKSVEEEKETVWAEIEGLREEGKAAEKQVDDMYFYDYCSCMKKNDITHDTPSFPSDYEGKAPDGSS